jgi:hypothetical protein
MLGIQRSWTLSLSSDVERMILWGKGGKGGLDNLRVLPWPAGPTDAGRKGECKPGVWERMDGGGPGVCDRAAEADVERM